MAHGRIHEVGREHPYTCEEDSSPSLPAEHRTAERRWVDPKKISKQRWSNPFGDIARFGLVDALQKSMNITGLILIEECQQSNGATREGATVNAAPTFNTRRHGSSW